METVVYALHKPIRMECVRTETPRALSSASGNISVPNRRNCLTRWLLELEAIEGCSLHAIGRLDKDTSGLLLVTNDGKFSNFLLRPGFCSKVYIADCLGVPDSVKMMKLKDGSIEISDKKNKKDKRLKRDDNGRCEMLNVKCENVQVVATWTKTHNEFKTPYCRLRLEMRTGQYRVVRRILGAVGLGVTRLHRESIGCLVLGNTPPPHASEVHRPHEIGGNIGVYTAVDRIVIDVEQSSHIRLSKETIQYLRGSDGAVGQEISMGRDDDGYDHTNNHSSDDNKNKQEDSDGRDCSMCRRRSLSR